MDSTHASANTRGSRASWYWVWFALPNDRGSLIQVLESSDGVVEQIGIGQSLDRGAEPKAIAARTATPAPIEVTEEDCVVRRLHGLLSPIQGTDGDALLRNLGCRALIVTGVSADVEIPDASTAAAAQPSPRATPSRGCPPTTPPR